MDYRAMADSIRMQMRKFHDLEGQLGQIVATRS